MWVDARRVSLFFFPSPRLENNDEHSLSTRSFGTKLLPVPSDPTVCLSYWLSFFFFFCRSNFRITSQLNTLNCRSARVLNLPRSPSLLYVLEIYFTLVLSYILVFSFALSEILRISLPLASIFNHSLGVYMLDILGFSTLSKK